MIPLRILTVAALTALSAGAIPAGAPASASRPSDGTVVSLRILPVAGRADVVIGVNGDTHVKDFTMSDPARIVVDIAGATLGMPAGASYDGVPRGPIKNVRYSQFRVDTVRVVITTDAVTHYHVNQSAGEVRVEVDGAPQEFATWQIGARATKTPAVLATVHDQLTPVSSPAVGTPADADPAPPMIAPVPTPVRTSPVSPAPVTRAADAPSVAQQSQQPVMTFNAEAMPIAEMIRIFGERTGRNIIADKAVTGTVTGSFHDLPWDVGLRELLNMNGYDATEDANHVIRVEPLDQIVARAAAQVAAEPMQTATVSLNFAKAVSVAPMVKERLTRDCGHGQAAQAQQGAAASAAGSGDQQQPAQATPGIANLTCPFRGAVTSDSLTNSLSITDVPSSLITLSAYAKSLDRRPPEVNIHAKIILVNRTALEGLGLRYDLGSATQYFNDIVPRPDSTGQPQTGPGQVALGGNTVAAIANATQRIPSAALQLVFSTAMGAFDFTSFLEALQQTSLLDTQAEPSGSTLNNRTLNLTSGSEVPIRVIDAGSGANATGSFPQAQVQLKQTGIILIVTPTVTSNGYIQMVVHVENSDVTFSGSDATAFPKQSVDNTVLVADGQTAVMGGLTQTTVSITKTGIPLLVDLPLVGKLFGVTQRQETKNDLLILITPHITDTGEQPGGGHQ